MQSRVMYKLVCFQTKNELRHFVILHYGLRQKIVVTKSFLESVCEMIEHIPLREVRVDGNLAHFKSEKV
jgi:hypothetical protein